MNSDTSISQDKIRHGTKGQRKRREIFLTKRIEEKEKEIQHLSLLQEDLISQLNCPNRELINLRKIKA